METLEDCQRWIEETKYLDYDESELYSKQQYLLLWNTAFEVLEEWEQNLLIYDTYEGGLVKDKREALNLKKSSYNKYLRDIRKKVRDALGIAPPLKNDNLIKYNQTR